MSAKRASLLLLRAGNLARSLINIKQAGLCTLSYSWITVRGSSRKILYTQLVNCLSTLSQRLASWRSHRKLQEPSLRMPFLGAQSKLVRHNLDHDFDFACKALKEQLAGRAPSFEELLAEAAKLAPFTLHAYRRGSQCSSETSRW